MLQPGIFREYLFVCKDTLSEMERLSVKGLRKSEKDQGLDRNRYLSFLGEELVFSVKKVGRDR